MQFIRHRLTLALGLVALAGLAFATIAPSAEAHERRTVAGKYTFVVGFLNEPALIDQPNGIDLRVSNAQTGDPVEGLEKTRKADLIVGGATKTVDLRARFGMKGAYTADLIPTKTGTWNFRFYGNIEGTPVDEKFESGPGRFNDVQNTNDLEFPVQTPSLSELAAQVQRQGTPAEAGAANSAPAPDVQRALDRADSARTTGIIFGAAGILIGLAGVGLALVAMRARRAASGRQEPV
jgi:hypothetical protein